MILDRFKLNGKVALVTGASAGIGFGSAQALAEAGANVVLCARTADKLEGAAAEIRKLGVKALAVPTDVNDLMQLRRLVDDTLAEFGRIDVLVNNAGGTAPTPALHQSVQDFEAAFHFNVGTAFELSKLCAPRGDRKSVV